ncbi:MAG: 4Fe-4S dicluster domain-containing protein, partial [Sedimentisphaerales bacterium]|nr:4Fe-4S dicluster domain-containing protein [Sedimentisphaerales bacterium]
KNYYRLIGHSCTSNLSPPTIKDNRNCLLCTQCLKVCPHKNIRFSTRKPYADFFSGIELKTAQAAFVLLVSGFVVYEILSEWPKSKAIIMWVPDQLIEVLGITGSGTGLFSATVMFVIYPAILFSSVVVLSKFFSRTSVGTIAVAQTFALLLVPTMAAAHLIKAVLKMTSRIPYWNHVFADPTGRQTAQRIFDKSLVLDKSIPDVLFPIISYTAAGILLIVLVATIIIFRKSTILQKYDIGVKIPLILGTLAYWSVFGGMMLMWRFCS